MKITMLSIVVISILAGCAQKKFDQRSYDRQNKAAEKSLDSI